MQDWILTPPDSKGLCPKQLKTAPKTHTLKKYTQSEKATVKEISKYEKKKKKEELRSEVAMCRDIGTAKTACLRGRGSPEIWPLGLCNVAGTLLVNLGPFASSRLPTFLANHSKKCISRGTWVA